MNTLYCKNKEEWRTWLESNGDKEKEIWLISPRKDSGRQKIVYNDAVEEALCFGWIDSIAKTFDSESFIQRYTPRNPKSAYSQQNIERLKGLAKEGKLIPSVLQRVQTVIQQEFVFPEDILEAIRNSEKAWSNYQNFSDSYKRIRVAYIDTARLRPEEFKRRLKSFIKKTEANKLIGFGGIEKYY